MSEAPRLLYGEVKPPARIQFDDTVPVHVLNSWSRGEITPSEIVAWVCHEISSNDSLVEDPLWMDIAIVDENNEEQLFRVPDLLRRLISATVDFEIPPDRLAAYRASAESVRSNPDATITQDTFWGVVLGLLPDVAPRWTEHLTRNCGERTGLYADEIGVLNAYALQQIRDGNLDALRSIGELIELIITQGDEPTRELVTIGFLEGVSNHCGHEPEALPIARLVHHLGNASLRALRELDQFWGTRTPGTD